MMTMTRITKGITGRGTAVSDVTRRVALATLQLSLAVALGGCGMTGDGGEASTNSDATTVASDRKRISDDTDGGHAIEVSGEEASYSSVDVTKTGEADGDEADFYGKNAAVFATEKATLDLSDATVTTDGTHANAIFSYGEGTTVNVSDSRIETSGNCSGGLMVTGGGTLNAKNLDIHTTGNSSAAIRSDRGGGTETVDGGTYETDGTGSPAIYSTADVTVRDATLKSTASQGVVVEGKNSVTLSNVDLTASNTKKNSDKSDWYQAIMIYQSMSGDATQGTASFSMSGGSLDNKNGDVLFVNNTVATVAMDGVKITNEDPDGNLMMVAAAGWGKEGSNGGHVTLDATNQELTGDILVDSVSSLNLHLGNGSTFAGAINPDGTSGQEHVSLTDGAKWTLTSDSHITSLTCPAGSIDLNGHVLYVGDATYVADTESTGNDIVTETKTTGNQGLPSDGTHPDGVPRNGSEPPARPDGENGEPPARPDGENGEPPARPDGENGEPPARPDGESSEQGRPSKKPSSKSSGETGQEASEAEQGTVAG